jgi:3-hydroxyisobutyrate dehydrogenase
MGHRIAFVGLGVMGYPIAGHLMRAGHDVTVFNRTLARADEWVMQYGGRAVPTPAEAAAGAEFVFCCVGNDEALADVVLSQDGVLAGMAPSSVLVDHTTSSALIARELYKRASTRNVGFLDAPVSGGREGAEQGTLSVMAGGRPEDFERAAPLIQSYSRCARLLGPTGSGQLAKMVNQICLAGVIEVSPKACTSRSRPGSIPRPWSR